MARAAKATLPGCVCKTRATPMACATRPSVKLRTTSPSAPPPCPSPTRSQRSSGPTGAGWLTEPLRAQYRAVWQGDGSRPGAGLTGGLNYYRASPLRPPREGDPAAAAVDLPEDAFTVPMPTLVLWAMQDSALPPELIDGLERWVPDLRVARIADGTHWVVHEQPGRVAGLIEAFLLSDG